MAAPYAQWAVQRLQAVAPAPQQAPQMADPQQRVLAQMWDSYPKAREALRMLDDYAQGTMIPPQMQAIRKTLAATTTPSVGLPPLCLSSSMISSARCRAVRTNGDCEWNVQHWVSGDCRGEYGRPCFGAGLAPGTLAIIGGAPRWPSRWGSAMPNWQS